MLGQLPASTHNTSVFLLGQIAEDITRKFYATVEAWGLIVTSSYSLNVTGGTA